MIDLDLDLAWYGVGVAVLAFLVHGLIRQFEVACPLAAALAALIKFVLIVAANPGFKPGWAMPVAGTYLVIALPISLVVGKVVHVIRSRRRPDRAAGSAGLGPAARAGVLSDSRPGTPPGQEPLP